MLELPGGMGVLVAGDAELRARGSMGWAGDLCSRFAVVVESTPASPSLRLVWEVTAMARCSLPCGWLAGWCYDRERQDASKAAEGVSSE